MWKSLKKSNNETSNEDTLFYGNGNLLSRIEIFFICPLQKKERCDWTPFPHLVMFQHFKHMFFMKVVNEKSEYFEFWDEDTLSDSNIGLLFWIWLFVISTPEVGLGHLFKIRIFLSVTKPDKAQNIQFFFLLVLLNSTISQMCPIFPR